MFGAVYGDVIGSYYENHCTKDYDFPFHKDSTFTDDSVLTAAVCKAILVNDKPVVGFKISNRAFEYAVQYKQFYAQFPNAGYGTMFRKWAADRYMGHNRSYGNGGAMRVVPIGYAYSDIEQIMLQAKASCLFTHNSHEAIRGAQAVAVAVFLARTGESKEYIKEFLTKKFRYDLDYSLEAISPVYTFDSSTDYSIPPAIVAFLESEDYESAVRKAVSLGGDADTMACIAGGIAEAFYKEIPDHIRKFCDSRIDITIKNTINEFCEKYVK